MKAIFTSPAFILLLLLGLLACSPGTKEKTEPLSMDALAERYVRCILEMGQYDSDIVDAYYGPEEWKPFSGTEAESIPSRYFEGELQLIQEHLALYNTSELRRQEQQRVSMLGKQVQAALTKLKLMEGEKLAFDEEASLLYDAQPPHFKLSYFDSLLQEIDQDLPGRGNLAERWAAYRKQFEIPKEKLDTVFQAAISEARKRTKAHYVLPEGENFKVEYVKDKPWSGYNYFQGGGYSLIQINTDHAIFVERAIDLACHEGYPGHHVFNVLLEQELVNKRGWKEFSLYPLFSPQSLIAEGSANFGIEVAFPAGERLRFEQEVLFPLAGLEPAGAEQYYALLGKIKRLDFAGNEAARRYLDGEISREEAADMLVKYNFYEPAKALQRTHFFDRYRSYVINYNLGQEIVRQYVNARGGSAQQPDKRWAVFQDILSNPYTASMLQ